jgi:hypothetical protein
MNLSHQAYELDLLVESNKGSFSRRELTMKTTDGDRFNRQDRRTIWLIVRQENGESHGCI